MNGAPSRPSRSRRGTSPTRPWAFSLPSCCAPGPGLALCEPGQDGQEPSHGSAPADDLSAPCTRPAISLRSSSITLRSRKLSAPPTTLPCASRSSAVETLIGNVALAGVRDDGGLVHDRGAGRHGVSEGALGLAHAGTEDLGARAPDGALAGTPPISSAALLNDEIRHSRSTANTPSEILSRIESVATGVTLWTARSGYSGHVAPRRPPARTRPAGPVGAVPPSLRPRLRAVVVPARVGGTHDSAAPRSPGPRARCVAEPRGRPGRRRRRWRGGWRVRQRRSRRRRTHRCARSASSAIGVQWPCSWCALVLARTRCDLVSVSTTRKAGSGAEVAAHGAGQAAVLGDRHAHVHGRSSSVGVSVPRIMSIRAFPMQAPRRPAPLSHRLWWKKHVGSRAAARPAARRTGTSP